MNKLLLTIMLCLFSSAASAESYQRQQRIPPPSDTCSLEEFASEQKAQEYSAKNGGQVFRDQDTHDYRVVKCNFEIGEQVLLVFNVQDD